MKPQTRDQFIEVCLRRLGYPVIDVNLDDDQIDDKVEEALLFFWSYHYNASERLAIIYELTSDDITNQFITVPDEILSVSKILIDDSNLLSGGFGTNIWHSLQNIAHDISFGLGASRGGLTQYSMMMTYLAEIGFQFNLNKLIEFQYWTHRIYIRTDWGKLSAGDKVVLEVYKILDPNTHPDLWGDIWLIEYCTALMGVQWGVNLSKFDGVELPSGVTLNGDKLYDRYNEIKLKMEEEMQSKYEEPVDFLVG